MLLIVLPTLYLLRVLRLVVPLQVDFAPPVGYKEPERPRPQEQEENEDEMDYSMTPPAGFQASILFNFDTSP